jgi:hypothetical protein
VLGLAGGILGVVLTVASLTDYPCARWNGSLAALSPLALALVPIGAWGARRPLRRLGRTSLRAVLAAHAVALAAAAVAHLAGLTRQRNLPLLAAVAALLALAAAARRDELLERDA